MGCTYNYSTPNISLCVYTPVPYRVQQEAIPSTIYRPHRLCTYRVYRTGKVRHSYNRGSRRERHEYITSRHYILCIYISCVLRSRYTRWNVMAHNREPSGYTSHSHHTCKGHRDYYRPHYTRSDTRTISCTRRVYMVAEDVYECRKGNMYRPDSSPRYRYMVGSS